MSDVNFQVSLYIVSWVQRRKNEKKYERNHANDQVSRGKKWDITLSIKNRARFLVPTSTILPRRGGVAMCNAYFFSQPRLYVCALWASNWGSNMQWYFFSQPPLYLHIKAKRSVEAPIIGSVCSYPLNLHFRLLVQGGEAHLRWVAPLPSVGCS